ncbi:MAG: ornithine carbamoyltransferase [Sporolactobacillus laevolacticus]|jgi:ornithine carbamoyltransferase|nr:ornithine carbamoyltransferase [Sporolactobacillus laevolacticus]
MHLLDISDLSADQITDIFHLADKLRSGNTDLQLKNKTFILFFPETSLRTQVTFEKGINDLGGRCLLFPSETLNKREALSDVIGYLENWADGTIVRHPDFSKLQQLAEQSSIPIINAMTSRNHPCEILSDLYTFRNLRPNFKELVYTFVGPKGNISRTWMDAAAVLNLTFNHVCVPGNEMCPKSSNYTFHTDLEAVLSESDVLLTDSLPDELRNEDYFTKYQITFERLRSSKPEALLNPCPPFYRDEEVSSDAISSNHFVGYEFKKNLLYVQQAIVLFCLSH